MRAFSESWNDFEIVQEPLAQITWYHNLTLLEKLQTNAQRLWYAKKTIENGWSRNVLVMQIEMGLYERQADQSKKISNFKDKLPSPQSELAHSMMKDPYNFEFLGVNEKVEEVELEKKLEQHVSKFLLELGSGFAYMGRQYPINVGGQDFWIDMLFYNVKLRCYVVVELKTKPFKPADAGQLNFYLTAIDKDVKSPEDNPTIGLVICKPKNKIVAEYALHGMEKPMGVSAFELTKSLSGELEKNLPTTDELEEELEDGLEKEHIL